MNEISVNPMLELSAGEILYIRIYPWYSSVANGKTICLKDVKISGLSKDMSPSNILAEQLSPEIRIDKTAFRDSLTLTYILKNSHILTHRCDERIVFAHPLEQTIKKLRAERIAE